MKRVGFLKKSEKIDVFCDPLLRDMGEIEKPGAMMGTQTLIRDEHPSKAMKYEK